MADKTITEALIEALKEPSVKEELISIFTYAAKDIQVTKKSTAKKDIEEGLLKHIVFSENEDVGIYMTVKEISDKLVQLEGNEDLDIRPRIFGRFLKQKCAFQKDSRFGRVYLIIDIVEDAENYEAKELVDKIGQIGEVEDIQDAVEEIENNEVSEPQTTFDLDSVDKDLIGDALDGYEDADDYFDELRGLSKKHLIKHVNKFKMPIICENKEVDLIVESIRNLMHIVFEIDTKKVKKEEVEEEPKPSEKPKEKKSKKDKKKEKKSKKDKKKDKKK